MYLVWKNKKGWLLWAVNYDKDIYVVLGKYTGSVTCSLAYSGCLSFLWALCLQPVVQVININHKISHKKYVHIYYWLQFLEMVSILIGTCPTISWWKWKKCHQIQGLFISRKHLNFQIWYVLKGNYFLSFWLQYDWK